MQESADITSRKEALREAAKAARQGLDPSLGESLCAHVLAADIVPPGAVVAGYWPLGDEIDIRPLMLALHERGHKVALPVTPKRGLPLRFRRWVPGAALIEGRFGTMLPNGEKLVPAFLLVPLLAFDPAGGRIGYGAGYYDRTLALLPDAFALGCAFAAQMVDAVPMGPYDARLDAIATEQGVMRGKG
jgi:5-formyltetrahydrofolate cyclo-ligase